MAYEQFQSFISKHMKFHLFQQELKSKIYATAVLVMYNMNLVQREREREKCDVFDIKMLKQEILSKKKKVKQNVKVSLVLC
jgi:hypothetical protein